MPSARNACALWSLALGVAPPPAPPPPTKTVFEVGTSKPVETLTEFVSPDEFYEKYGKPGNPVLFKGVAKSMPAFKYWKDPNYLAEKFGDKKLLVEEGYGHQEHVVMGEGSETVAEAAMPKSMKIRDFVANFTTHRLIATESLPRSMAQHVFLPPVLNCGGYQAGMHSTSIWWSHFATKSKIHHDDYDNFNCQYSGSKRWAMWHSKDRKTIKKKDMGRVNNVTASGASGCSEKIDVTNVDLATYPGWDALEHIDALVEPGDCLFIPEEWSQSVWAEGDGPWISTSLWWGTPTTYDPRSCYRLEERGFDVKAFLSTFRDCNFLDVETTEATYCIQRLKMPTGDETDERFYNVTGYCDPDKKVLPEHDVPVKKYLEQLDVTLAKPATTTSTTADDVSEQLFDTAAEANTADV